MLFLNLLYYNNGLQQINLLSEVVDTMGYLCVSFNAVTKKSKLSVEQLLGLPVRGRKKFILAIHKTAQQSS